ncbi:MAG: PhoX family phosphatase [Hyphomicrobium sp.]
MSDTSRQHGTPESQEDVGSNPSGNPTLGDVIGRRLSRREVLAGALAVSALSAIAADLDITSATHATGDITGSTPSFRFIELDAGVDATHHVAEGYDADVLISWGDAVVGDAPAFDTARQSAASQARQFGYNNDYVGYVPIDGSSTHGLLVVNHEYTNEELMFPGIAAGRTRAEIQKALSPDQITVTMMAHGGSVIEVRRTDGKWAVVPHSKYARRITAETEMAITGPAAGHARMRTNADPRGRRVKGMINNCAGGVTPWGTWLTCEENINFYFDGKDAAAQSPEAKALARYGFGKSWNPWSRVDPRFDMAREPNEPNRFGWVVEIDPFDPASVPKKRTAMGRFKHEGAGNVVNKDGRFVVYQGDDERFDYVYRFVTDDSVDTKDRAANRDLLDSGTLSVARFDADGSGTWLPLTHGQGGLVAGNGFADQGDVVIHARLAADVLGATKMDRPEDIEVDPKTNRVFVMLTNNTRRKAGDVDAANPRAGNEFGHIIEIHPHGGDHAAATFRWEILLRCGDPAIAPVGATFNPATTNNGWFGMPDNCVVDAAGRLWVATDGNNGSKTGRSDGVWAVETSGPARGTSKLFYRVPAGAEMCGPYMTPDMETFFVAVQHPGETPDDTISGLSTFDKPLTRWPDFKDGMPPRPSVVAITRKGGGKIAS